MLFFLIVYIVSGLYLSPSSGIKGEKGAITDSAKSQSTESKSYRTAKTVIYDIVRWVH